MASFAQFVSITANSGIPVSVRYTISTPTATTSKRIDPGLPTVLFLHPLFLGQTCFHYQFADWRLRKFNLVALDLRGHGDTAGVVDEDYDLYDAVEDVVKVMKALRLPPSHLVGVNLGASIGLELAATHPRLALSLTCISPSSWRLKRDDLVIQEIEDIYECLEGGLSKRRNQSALQRAACGMLQLGVNDLESPLLDTLVNLSITTAANSWAGRVKELSRATVRLFASGRPCPRSMLRGIRCPVSLVRSGADVGYVQESVDETYETLQSQGTLVRTYDLPDAPQWAHLSHHPEVNQLIHDIVVEFAAGRVPVGSLLQSKPFPVESPFEDVLCGDPDSDSDDEDCSE